MSDPLFEMKHLDLVKNRTKGILHFSQMHMQKKEYSMDGRRKRNLQTVTLEPIRQTKA